MHKVWWIKVETVRFSLLHLLFGYIFFVDFVFKNIFTSKTSCRDFVEIIFETLKNARALIVKT